MKTLVLGASGMAGHVIALYLKERGHKVDTLSATNPLDNKTKLIDVTDNDKLTTFLDEHTYDAVINVAALLVKQSEERKTLAVLLNSHFPLFLEQYYRDSNTKIVHISTDGVFSGENSPYTEDSAYDGQGFYDRTKALGEIINDKDLTIRTSIIGPDRNPNGTSLLNWFLSQKGEISGFDKLFWKGVTTLELAKAIEQAIEQNLTGVYNLVPDKAISKYELLMLCKAAFKKQDITIRPNSDVQFARGLTNTRTDFKFTISNYRTMLQEIKSWVDSHPNLYDHYYKKV